MSSEIFRGRPCGETTVADNVYWSTLYLGNFAQMDTNELTNSVETATPLLATFGAGAGNALATNIVNVRTDAGFLDNTVTTDNDLLDFDTVHYNLGAGTVSTKLDAVLMMNATVTFYDQTTLEAQIAVFQTQTGDTFAVIRDSQPELASQGIDRITFNSVVSSNYTGITQDAADTLDFVCFTSGTMIDTPTGPRRMDRLRRGDLILTLDSGPQPVVWIGKRRLRFKDRPHLAQPIRIKRGSFGDKRPNRDLLLSPNHRLLVETSPAFALYDPLGALAPVKALTRIAGIRALPGRREITYFALLLPRHEVVIANGIAAESLYPGPEVFAALTPTERLSWLRLTARGDRLTGAVPARLLLSTSEARAAHKARLLTLPETKPIPLTWSLARHARAPLPDHIARRA
jgi:hypothetical protein